MTYYERWLQVNEQLAVKHGLVTAKELESGVSGSRLRRSPRRLSRPQLQLSILVAVFLQVTILRFGPSLRLASACAPET